MTGKTARLEQSSGQWAGFWIQSARKGEMDILMRVDHGNLKGEGKDRTGQFTIRGTYDRSGFIEMTKQYRWTDVVERGAASMVHYQGQWNGDFVAGHWWQDANASNCGAFEIWPEQNELEPPPVHMGLDDLPKR